MARASKELLEQVEGIEVVGVAGNAGECLSLAELHHPDLVLLDYQLPDMPGTDVAKRIHSHLPECRIVIFTGVDVSDMANRFAELPLSGVISKGTSHTSIQHMLHCIIDNYTVLPRSVVSLMQSDAKAGASRQELSEDEISIMRLLIKGETLEQIAEAIHVSKRSVDNYQKRIYDKLGVKNKVQAIEAFINSPYYTT